jgi:uncharacterized phage infection (PIP) family protein YhgE
MVLALVAVCALGWLSVVIVNVNTRLDDQQRVNETSIATSQGIVDVNDRLTLQLQELTALTTTAQSALDATDALNPLLAKLQEALAPAAQLLSSATGGAELTNEQLTNIQAILGQVQDSVLPLVDSAAAFGDQGTQLLTTVQDLVNDLEQSVAAAKTINQMLPLPG